MCRSIRRLYNIDPPATEEEIAAAARQFVRKISGSAKPSRANEEVFAAAVAEIAGVAGRLLGSLESAAPPRDRQRDAAAAQARAARRYGG